MPVKTSDTGNGTFKVEFEPKVPGTCTAQVYFSDVAVPLSPFQLVVAPGKDFQDASKVKVHGDGIQKQVFASLPVSFTIDASQAGEADIDVVIQVC